VRMTGAWLVLGKTPSADGCDSAQLLGGGVFYATAGIGSLSPAECWQPHGAIFTLLRRGWFRAAIALPLGGRKANLSTTRCSAHIEHDNGLSSVVICGIDLAVRSDHRRRWRGIRSKRNGVTMTTGTFEPIASRLLSMHNQPLIGCTPWLTGRYRLDGATR
jgi:hypothetical protein